jgi:hypothetical protein
MAKPLSTGEGFHRSTTQTRVVDYSIDRNWSELELEWAGTANTVRARRGEPTVRVAGLPGELLLYVFGRQRAAQVEVSGPADAVKAVRRARFGM